MANIKIIKKCVSLPVRAHDKRIACDEEFSDSEDEGQGGRRNAANYKKSKRVKTEEEKDGEEKKGEMTGAANNSSAFWKPKQKKSLNYSWSTVTKAWSHMWAA